MLNKDVCKKCINDFYPIIKWSKEDESRWECHKVMCPNRDDKKLKAFTITALVTTCPYKLQHAVAAGMKESGHD